MSVADDVLIRPIGPGDLDACRWVVYRAYLPILLELYGREAAQQYELRSVDFMQLYLDRDPDGSFGAFTSGGDALGVIFCFAWGEVGWFGSLGVVPEWGGRGLGRRLVARAMEYLRSRRCRLIGLETWPQEPRAHRFYAQLGFAPARPTLKFSRAAADAATASTSGRPRAGVQLTWLDAGASGVALEAMLSGAHEVTGRLNAGRAPEPSVDYQSEIRAGVASGWADALLVEGEAGPEAFALTYRRRAGGTASSALDVRLLCVAPGPDERQRFTEVVGAAGAWAAGHDADLVTIDVNLRHARAASLLRRLGFVPVYELLRMVQPAAAAGDHGAVVGPTRSRLLECARWAG